jgi:hypothetical protein
MDVVLKKLQQTLAGMEAGGDPITAHWATARYPQDGSTEIELVKALSSRLQTAKQQSSGAGATS